MAKFEDQPPEGMSAWWTDVYRGALKALRAQGSWAAEQKPLLDEYVRALCDAGVARAGDDGAAYDRHVKRAMALADQLALTPRGRKAAGVGEPAGKAPADSFDGLDELAARRGA